MLVGMVKVSLRLDPKRVVIAVGEKVADAPVPVVNGAIPICTCAGLIVPEGKPVPVRLTEVTPGCPADGEVVCASVIDASLDCANASSIEQSPLSHIRSKNQQTPDTFRTMGPFNFRRQKR